MRCIQSIEQLTEPRNSIKMKTILALVTFSASLVHTHGSNAAFGLTFTSNDEEFDEYLVQMEEDVPQWMNGIYIRNGMGLFEHGDRNFTHPFDGLAKLYSFKFEGGSKDVHFSAKMLRSNFYKDSVESGHLAPYLVLGKISPEFGWIDKVRSLVNGIDNTNINVVKFGGRTFHTLSDYWHSYEINPLNLETLGLVNPPLPNADFINHIAPIPASSHPVKEYGTDNYINFYSLVNPLPWQHHSINVVRIKSPSDTELLASISRVDIPYMHSLAATKDYVIVIAHPCYINWMTIARYQNPLDSLEFQKDKPTDIYAVHIKTKKVTHFTADSYFFMHNINAYQEGNKIYIDETSYPDNSMMYVFAFDNIRGNSPEWPASMRGDIKRITLDFDTKTAEVRGFPVQLEDEHVNSLDLPVINPDFMYKHYCYTYGQVLGDDGMNEVKLAKKDLCGEGDRVWYKENHFPSESWFQPNPNGVKEDDGIVMNLVLDGDTQKSYILFLDGQTFEEVNIGHLPTWLPFTLHGRFFASCSEEDQTCS